MKSDTRSQLRALAGDMNSLQREIAASADYLRNLKGVNETTCRDTLTRYAQKIQNMANRMR